MTAAALALVVGMAVAVDGDTLRMPGWPDMRLWGVDAPETSQPGGVDARTALSALVTDAWVVCEPRGASYGRIVAQCWLGGVDLAERLVRDGWAWDAPAYSKGKYADEQESAMAARRGIWAREKLPCPAWIWRSNRSKCL